MSRQQEEQPKLLILSGLPGSGKSTAAANLAPARAIATTDDYPGLYSVQENGNLQFHGMDMVGKLPLIVHAHMANQEKVRELMKAGEDIIVVPNTNCQRWEFQPYLKLSEEFGYIAERIDLFDAGLSDEELAKRCVHNVPVEGIAKMRSNYTRGEAWREDDPRPPWGRT
jgi:predicted kinase